MSKEIIWSEYQKAIFEDVKSGAGHTIVSALAGSAKTTSLLEALKYIPSTKKVLVVAFNKKIAQELQDRAPGYSNITISTLHSFGFRVIRQSLGNVKFDSDKDFRIIQKLLEPLKENKKSKDDFETIFELKKCVSLCKSLIIDHPVGIDELMDEYDVSPGSLSREDFIQTTIIALGECKKKKDSISFDDMIYFPFVLNLKSEQFDFVFIDEVQDLTNSQVYLATSACKKNGRLIVFGDDFQVLYKFRGANLNALVSLQEKLKAKVLDLPISYRCPKKVIFEAQKFVPGIKYAPGAKDGQVINILEKEIVSFVKPNDYVISRTNAPLVKLCFELWKNKIPASIKGKDLGPSLLGLISQSKKKTVKAFLGWLNEWAAGEIKRLRSKNRKPTTVTDRVECLTFLADGKERISDLIDTVKSLFEDKSETGIVQLGTAHWFKGAEQNRVFVLMKTFVFGDGKEEQNCLYVSITRAKETLFYVR